MIVKPDIKNLTVGQLREWLALQGIAAYRAGQILRWVYNRQTDRFDHMTDLSQADREKLTANFSINRLQKVRIEVSADGSRKYLFGLNDGQQIESVLMDIEGVEPHYILIVDRDGTLDTLEVQVEVNEKTFSDEIKVLQGLSRTIEKEIKDLLGISCHVRLVEPKTIARSEGKAQRVIDNRPK